VEESVLAGTRAAIAAATGVSLLLLPACSHAAGPARVPAPVTMTYCGSGPQARPSVLEIVCGTTEITARSLTWSAWGKQIATGVGTAVVDLCTYEDCHTGSYGSAPIVVIASKIVRCTRGTQAYSKLQYVFVGGSPLPAVPAGTKYSNYIAAPDRSVPPANQTIGLTC
jgi:hypothetical protein